MDDVIQTSQETEKADNVESRYTFAILCMLTALLPFVIIPAPYLSYRIPRLVFLDVMALMLAYLIAAAVLKKGIAAWKKTPADFAVIAFVLLLVVSTIATRQMDGAVIFLSRFSALAVVYFAASRLIDNREKITILVEIFLVTAAISSLVAAFEMYEPVRFAGRILISFWRWQIIWGERVDATFDDPNFFGGFLAIAIPMLLCLLVAPGSRGRKIFYALMLAPVILAMKFSFSRSAWFACAGAIGFLLLIVVPRLGLFAESRRIKTAALIVIVSLSAAVALTQVFNPWNTSVVKRLSSTSGFLDEQGYRKLSFWRIGAEMMADRPLAGVGLSNYSTYYPLYRQKVYSGREVDSKIYKGLTYDAYNDYIELGAEAGIPALAAYLATLALFFFHGIRFAWDWRTDTRDRWLMAGLLSSCAAFCLHSTFFQFPMKNLSSFFILWLFMALGFALVRISREGASPPAGSASFSRPSAAARAALAAFFLAASIPVLWFCYKLVSCNIIYQQAAIEYGRGRLFDSLEVCRDHISSCPAYRNDKLYHFAGNMLMVKHDCGEAVSLLEKGLENYPYNYILLSDLYRAYTCNGQPDMARQAAEKAGLYSPPRAKK